MNHRVALFLTIAVVAITAAFAADADDWQTKTSAYDFTVLDGNQKPYPLRERRQGKFTLLMNIASECGFTKSGYATAAELQIKYKDIGFTTLGFPCNQFGGQEPGTEEEIQERIARRFGPKFEVMAKVDVNGEGASPLWKWLQHNKPGLFGTEFIKWNFSAFLVDGDGQIVERFAPGATVEDVEKHLLPLLAKTSPMDL